MRPRLPSSRGPRRFEGGVGWEGEPLGKEKTVPKVTGLPVKGGKKEADRFIVFCGGIVRRGESKKSRLILFSNDS